MLTTSWPLWSTGSLHCLLSAKDGRTTVINPKNMAMQSWQHQTVLPAVLVGTVTRVGYYRDTLPQLIITVRKEEAMAIPFRNRERVPVPFVINGKRFAAGIRTTNRSATVMICPDLNDAERNPARLTDLLYDLGWNEKKSRVELTIEDGVINCF